MDEKIINYLMIGYLRDPRCEGNHHIRVRSAYILAKKEFQNMSEKEKKRIREKIKNERQANRT